LKHSNGSCILGHKPFCQLRADQLNDRPALTPSLQRHAAALRTQINGNARPSINRRFLLPCRLSQRRRHRRNASGRPPSTGIK
jgi:hypothetical protein